MVSDFPAIIAGDENRELIYQALLQALTKLGNAIVEEKMSSLHIVAGRVAFLGVHPRRGAVRLNIVLNRSLANDRCIKSEAVSKTSFHNEVNVSAISEIDIELVGWITEAYRRVTAPKP